MIDLPNNIILSENIPYCSIKYNVAIDLNALPSVTSPNEAFELLLKIWNTDTISLREEFIILLLNNAKRVLGWSIISKGGRSATIVEPSLVFQIALLSNAASIVLAHNHPSNQLKASSADISLTKRLKGIGDLFGIDIDDHIIMTPTTFTSFHEQGLI